MNVLLGRRTDEYFEVRTPPSDEPQSNLSLLIEYRWTTISGQINRTNFSVAQTEFSYRPDPNITSVYPVQHLYA